MNTNLENTWQKTLQRLEYDGVGSVSTGHDVAWKAECVQRGTGSVVWQMDVAPGVVLAGLAQCLCAHVRYAVWNLEGKYWCGIVWKQVSVLNPARKHRQLPSKMHPNPPGSFVWHFYCGPVSRNVNLLLMTFFLLKLGEKPDNKWKIGALVPMATVWAFRWGQHRLLYV